ALDRVEAPEPEMHERRIERHIAAAELQFARLPAAAVDELDLVADAEAVADVVVELEDDGIATLRIVDEHDRRTVHRRGDEIDIAVAVDIDRGRGRRDQIVLEAERNGLLLEPA